MKMKKLTLNQREAAKVIGVHPDTLRAWDKTGKGPPTIETPAGLKRYPVSELEKFVTPEKSAA